MFWAGQLQSIGCKSGFTKKQEKTLESQGPLWYRFLTYCFASGFNTTTVKQSVVWSRPADTKQICVLDILPAQVVILLASGNPRNHSPPACLSPASYPFEALFRLFCLQY